MQTLCQNRLSHCVVHARLAGKSQRALLLLASDGADYAINLAVFANISAGTSFQIPQGAMETLSMYLLDGQQYMVHAAADAHGNGTCQNISTFHTTRRLDRIADRGLSCACRLRHQHQGPRDSCQT